MRYILYVSEKCTSCDQAITYLESHNIEFESVDLKNMINPPKNVMIVPSLVKNGKLIAFGPDIPGYFNRTA